MKEYYSIGEMAKLNFISPHTLRYYDKIGLLKPGYVNPETGYRYYSYRDFLLLDAIQYMQQFDMSLDEIKEQFEQRTVAKTLDLYEHQLDQICEHISALRNIEKRIRHNIDNLKDSRDRVFRTRIQVVSHKRRYAIMLDDPVRDDDEYEVAIRKLGHKLYQNHFQFMGDYMGIKRLEDLCAGEYDLTLQIGNMCTERPPHQKVRAFPAGDYLQICHIGPTDQISQTYKKMLTFIETEHLQVSREVLEIYAVDYIDTKDLSELVTVIELKLY